MAHPIHQASEKSPFGSLTPDQFYQKHRILHHHSYMLNSHNMNIFTQSWRPLDSAPARPAGLVAMVHGYVSDSSWLFQLTAVALAKLGFLAVALDLRGHGLSDGRRGHIPDVGAVVDDCVQFFDSVRSASGPLPAFLYGESLGGAVAALVALRQKGRWDGLVLNGAMCGVSARFKPPWPLEKLLPLAALVAPSWRVVVTGSLVEKSYKEKWKRELVRRSPTAQRSEHAPASTALELLRVCGEIGRRCAELELPLLVVHGGADSVCDAESAELVYESARSEDKTLRVLPGVWHQIIGEEEEAVELGFGIIYSWLKDRAANLASGRF